MTTLDLRDLGTGGRRALATIATGCRDQAPALFDRLAGALVTAADEMVLDLDLPLADAAEALTACRAHAFICTAWARSQTDDNAARVFVALAQTFATLHESILKRTDPRDLAEYRAQTIPPPTAA